MNLVLMADGAVGRKFSEWMLRYYHDDIALVVTTSENGIFSAALEKRVGACVFRSAAELSRKIENLECVPDLGILVWWPALIPRAVIESTRLGFVNTHPSYLPHNRGKHYNFWAIVEQAPFGVSLHFVDDGIDSGAVIARKEIQYDWEDDGGTLYQKAQKGMLELLMARYPRIREFDISAESQDPDSGSIHFASELETASRIDIDAQYVARDLFNRLRARTFPGHPACSFSDEGVDYEVRIEIKRKP